jgi:hypothetical protein
MIADIGGDDGDEAGFVDDASQHAVSRSYEWLLAVLNHLSSKCLIVVVLCDACVSAAVVFTALDVANRSATLAAQLHRQRSLCVFGCCGNVCVLCQVRCGSC